MRNFRELQIWQKGMDIVVDVYALTERLPAAERYGLVSQLQRAAISVPSNIAEGCSRESDKEFRKFLEYSIGSTFEIETQVRAAVRLCLLDPADAEPVLSRIDEQQRMTNAFISSVKRRSGGSL